MVLNYIFTYMNYIMGKQKQKLSTIMFTAEQHHILLEWATKGRPYEVCGIIGGKGNHAQQIYQLPNIASDPRTRYLIDPKAFVSAYYEIERNGLEMIGVVHSHPTSLPIPSPTDIVEAAWPGIYYVIIGFEGNVASLRVWEIYAGHAEETDVIIEDSLDGQA